MNKYYILRNIWGIKKKKLKLILGFAGVSELCQDSLPKKISKNIDMILIDLINSISTKGKYNLKSKIESFINLKLIRGLYHLKGLPVHGQSSKRNAKTQKKIFKNRLKINDKIIS